MVDGVVRVEVQTDDAQGSGELRLMYRGVSRSVSVRSSDEARMALAYVGGAFGRVDMRLRGPAVRAASAARSHMAITAKPPQQMPSRCPPRIVRDLNEAVRQLAQSLGTMTTMAPV